MKSKQKHIVFKLLVLVVAVTTVLTESGYCQTDGYAAMIQQSPAGAGRVTPEAGVHSFETDKVVTITAIAKPGYQFICWLGNVADATSNQTTMIMDSPKMVIAVFERNEYAFLAEYDGLQRGSSRGGMVGVPSRVGQGPAINPGEPKMYDWDWPTIPEEPVLYRDMPVPESGSDMPVPESGSDLPVPDEESDFPVPTPEPTTIMLFGIGAMLMRVRGRKKNA